MTIIVRIVLLLPLFFLGATGASAQELGAKQHFEAGQKHFDAGRFAEAAESYAAAYAAAPSKHALLYNIGLAYDKAGEDEKALAFYQDYLQREPQGAAAAEVQASIERLNEKIKDSQPTASEEKSETIGTKDEPPAPEPAPADSGSERDHVEPLAPTPKQPGGPKSASLSKGWYIGGAGFALMAAGVGTGLWARSKEHAVESRYNFDGVSYDQIEKIARKGKIWNAATIGLEVVGAAGLVVGAYLIWTDRREEEVIAPMVGKGEAGVVYSAIF
jgi:tetratricopeptide (TPR) repeat protein